MKRGDVDACFASGECDHIIQGTYKVTAFQSSVVE
jgi:hypothetical protein